VEAVFADPDAIEVHLADYIRAHAKTSALIQVLRSSGNWEVRYTLCWVFHLYPATSARQALLERCFDRNVEVRNAAADAYYKVGRVEDGPILMTAYRRERSVRVRRTLLEALGGIRYQGAVPLLISLLDDARYRRDAIDHLGEMRGAEARAALVRALQEETDERERWAIEGCIMRVDGRARRDDYERQGRDIPRPLTAAEIERLIVERPPETTQLHTYLLLNASIAELKQAIRTSRRGEVRDVVEQVLFEIKYRDRRGL
jgi:HEAT repeat protein